MNKNYEQCQELKKMFLECIHKKTLSESHLYVIKSKKLMCQEFINNQQKKAHHQDLNQLVCSLFSSS